MKYVSHLTRPLKKKKESRIHNQTIYSNSNELSSYRQLWEHGEAKKNPKFMEIKVYRIKFGFE